MKKQLQNLKQEFSNFPTRKQEYVIKDKKIYSNQSLCWK